MTYLPTVKAAAFIGGFPHVSKIPEIGLNEVAFIGRSNVGKSTLINRLTGRNKLAKTSKTPGQTKDLNYFQVTCRDGVGRTGDLLLVDLPGFGYAKLSKSELQRLDTLVSTYISERAALQAVCLLNDCRREPHEKELAIRDLAFNSGKHVYIVATKIDKIGKTERNKRLDAIARGYGLERTDIISVGEGLSIDVLWKRLFLVTSLGAKTLPV